MLYFVEALGQADSQTVGLAVQKAKQRYFNTLGAGSFSNFDEKSLAVMTLYGLPMLQVELPNPPTPPRLEAPIQVSLVSLDQLKLKAMHIPFQYDPISDEGLGTYFTVRGWLDTQSLGFRPVEPRASYDIHLPDQVAHGALFLGGTFFDMPIDPVITRIITDANYIPDEPAFPVSSWYPAAPGTINRFVGFDGELSEQLVVLPGQFYGLNEGPPTTGVQRLYSNVDFEIYYAPEDATDFIAPNIWEVEVKRSVNMGINNWMIFRALVEDSGGGTVQRVVALYRQVNVPWVFGYPLRWSKVELTYDPSTGWASATELGAVGWIEYFIQAVDSYGNVALALDKSNPFREYLGYVYVFGLIMKP
jgi:hypothetical protein